MTSQWDTGDEEWICRAALCGEKTDFHISFKLDLVIVVPSRRRMPVRQLELKAWRDHSNLKIRAVPHNVTVGEPCFLRSGARRVCVYQLCHDLRVAEFCVWSLRRPAKCTGPTSLSRRPLTLVATSNQRPILPTFQFPRLLNSACDSLHLFWK